MGRQQRRAPEPLVAFCEAEYPTLVALLTFQTGDRQLAQDLAQHTIEKLCLHWDDVQAHPNPQAWLFRVALNARRSAWRSRTRHREVVERLATIPAGAHPASDEIDLLDAIGDLPDRERKVILCRYLLDLSVATTAEIVGCPENTVKTLTRRALMQMRRDDEAAAEARTP